jgi:hypothetical protein
VSWSRARRGKRGPRFFGTSPRPWATRANDRSGGRPDAQGGLAVAGGASVLRSRNSWRRIANLSSLGRNQAARSRLSTLCLC